jgi:hypothetical protein
MFELTHKLHVIANDVKGLEAGYSGSNHGVVLMRLFEDGRTPISYKVELKEIGEVSSHDMFAEFDKLPTSRNVSAFRLLKKLNTVLEIFKGFAVGYTTVNMETLMIEYKDTLYKAKITELGEDTLQEYIKELN